MSYTGWKPENDKTVSGLCQGDPHVRITGSSVWTGVWQSGFGPWSCSLTHSRVCTLSGYMLLVLVRCIQVPHQQQLPIARGTFRCQVVFLWGSAFFWHPFGRERGVVSAHLESFWNLSKRGIDYAAPPRTATCGSSLAVREPFCVLRYLAWSHVLLYDPDPSTT